jgi:hypothetical protein
MACSKFTLTNTGSTYTSFNYRRCSDNMLKYQVGLKSNQTKNIWLLNNTFNTPQLFEEKITITEESFPPVE